MNPTPSAVTHNWEGIHHSQFPPEERRIWTPHLAPHLLRPAPERGAPPVFVSPSAKHLALKASGVCIHKTHKVNKLFTGLCVLTVVKPLGPKRQQNKTRPGKEAYEFLLIDNT